MGSTKVGGVKWWKEEPASGRPDALGVSGSKA